jgi:hypothetical protein
MIMRIIVDNKSDNDNDSKEVGTPFDADKDDSGNYQEGVESLQSHLILTMSHWSSGLTCLLPATRVTGSNPLGGLM